MREPTPYDPYGCGWIWWDWPKKCQTARPRSSRVDNLSGTELGQKEGGCRLD